MYVCVINYCTTTMILVNGFWEWDARKPKGISIGVGSVWWLCDLFDPHLPRQHPQVALWDVLLPYYKAQSGYNGSICKTSPSVDWDKSMSCYANTMSRMGYPYKKRSAFHVHFWPLQVSPIT